MVAVVLSVWMGCAPSSETAVREAAVGVWVCPDFRAADPDGAFKGLLAVNADGTYARYVTFEDLDKDWRRNGYLETDSGAWAVGAAAQGVAVTLAPAHQDETFACRRAPTDPARALCASLHGAAGTTYAFSGWTADALIGTFPGAKTCAYARQDWAFDPPAPRFRPIVDDPLPDAAASAPVPVPVPVPAAVAAAAPAAAPVPAAAPSRWDSLRQQIAASSGDPALSPTLSELYRAFRDEVGCNPAELRTDAGTLRILRNTPYAMAGFSFSSPDLAAAFAAEPWYAPKPGVDRDHPPDLTAADQACVQALKAAEDGR